MQVTRRGWNRFDKAKKKIFLRWFAATCNAMEAARRAGVGYSTVYDHRMNDPRFAEGWDRALEQGYARLEAKLIEMQFEQVAGEAIEFDGGFEPDGVRPHPAPAEAKDERPCSSPLPPTASLRVPPSPAEGGGAKDDAPDRALVDPVMAMQLLKQHKAEVTRIRADRAAEDARSSRRRKKAPTHDRERLASDAEVRRALVRSLQAFGVRVTAED